MKNLVKVFLAVATILACLVSAKIVIEFIESNSKKYFEVD